MMVVLFFFHVLGTLTCSTSIDSETMNVLDMQSDFLNDQPIARRLETEEFREE